MVKPTISAAVEGMVDEAVLCRLVEQAGGVSGPVYGKNGKQWLRQKIQGYNSAAFHSPWIVLVDLDHDAECAPPLRQDWLPNPAPGLCFRIAVRAIESWLLGDREHLSAFLGVGVSKIPADPDAVEDPKLAMVNLAQSSRRHDIRADMVPRPGSGREVGPAYSSRLIEFVTTASNSWRPEVAATRSDSLNRCLRCLRKLISSYKGNGR